MTVPAPEIPPMENRFRPFTVVCFGDSITGCRPGEPYRHQYLKWCDLLEMMLEARLGPGAARDLEAIGRKILDSGARLCFLQYALPRAADPATAWSHHALANPPAAEAAHRYRELGIPLSAIVADYFHWVYEGDWDFDRAFWPDPAEPETCTPDPDNFLFHAGPASRVGNLYPREYE